MVIIFYFIQLVYGIVTGYVSGQGLEREAEIFGTMFMIATLISIVSIFFGGAAHHVILTFLVWLFVSLIVSEVVKTYFSD